MKYYKELLLDKLSKEGWELEENNEDIKEWWFESYWRVKSIRQAYGHEVYILFLVDPQYDGQDKSSAVFSIGAFTKLPPEKLQSEGICTIYLVKGKLELNILEITQQLNEHRNIQNS